MTENTKRLDLDQNIGRVILSDGESRLPVPKLSLKRLIRVVKYLGIEGTKLWNDMQGVLTQEDLESTEKAVIVLEDMEEEQLLKIFSILLDLEQEEVVALDLNEMLDIVLVYVEKTNISKTFSQVRRLYKATFQKELPDVGKWLEEKQAAGMEILEKRKAAKQAVPEPEKPKTEEPLKTGTA